MYQAVPGTFIVIVTPYWNVNNENKTKALTYSVGNSNTILECK